MIRPLAVLAWALAAAGLPAQAQVLFGLRNPGDGGRQLVSVDPAGGAVSPVSASLSPPLGTASGVVALDAAGARFFFVGTPSGESDARLYTVDTQTGAVLASPVLTGSATAFVNALEYDAGAGVLYGLRNPGDGGRQLVTLDPLTGGVTALGGSISPPLPGASGVSALDAPGARFFFVGTPTGETDSRLYSVDTATGAVLSSPTIAGSAAAFVEAMEYDAAAGVLFALRNPGDGGRQLVTLDPASAAVTPVSGSISPPLPGSSGVSALDAAGARFFFIGTPSGETDARLFSVDTGTGAVLASPTLAGSAAAFFQGLAFAPEQPPPVPLFQKGFQLGDGLEMLRDGRLHLSGIAKLVPHLNRENRDAVLARAARKSKREIEELLAELAPRPDAPTAVRRLPVPAQLRPDGVAARALPGSPTRGRSSG